ncbi:MAG TPA: phosphoribosyltransferase [Usitatibacter sp.]|nr:phosphoribosyltransferase [Usitatibacter sp.]
MKRFHDRADAGRTLASQLAAYAGRHDVVVLGLPRGGVPVAAEVARVLRAPLDVFVVRKLGVPGQEEVAMGAIASGGVEVRNPHVVRSLSISDDVFHDVAERERRELERREQEFRGTRPLPRLAGKTVIVVDDGLATGASMRAALAALRGLRPARIVVAVPVGALETCASLRAQADEVVCAMAPEDFLSVGAWYEDFEQTTDAEVKKALH